MKNQELTYTTIELNLQWIALALRLILEPHEPR
jgi:hypothetical protein